MHIQQRLERAGKVGGALRVVHVVPRQQDLRNGAVVLGEQLVINVHDAALAHRGRRLLHAQLLGPLGQAQPRRTHGDGAGGHQDHLMPHPIQIRQNADQLFHPVQIHRAGVMGEGGRAHLHNDTLLIQTPQLPSGKIPYSLL